MRDQFERQGLQQGGAARRQNADIAGGSNLMWRC